MAERAPFVVCWDPGHGGPHTTQNAYFNRSRRGAMANGVIEKAVNLVIGKVCHELLKGSSWPVWSLMTRADDEDMSLEMRGLVAGRNGADLVVSLHCDINPDPKLFGLRCYVRPEDRLAMATGRFIMETAPEVLRPKNAQPYETNRSDWTMRANNVLTAHSRDYSAVLVEMGFLSNSSDAAFLRDPYGRLELARCLVQAVEMASQMGPAR